MTKANKIQIGAGLLAGATAAVIAYQTPQEEPVTAALLFGGMAFLFVAGVTALFVPSCPQCPVVQ